MGVIRRREISQPLMSPPSNPTLSAMATPISTVPMPASAPPMRWKNSPAVMADRFASPTMDRSIPPVSMAIITAIDRMPSSGRKNAMDSKL